MTENSGPLPGSTDTPPPPNPPFTQRPPLRRVRTDRVLAGVAGGFARWLGIDPVIVRVVLVVLALFGGSGLLLYLIGWLLIPEDGDPSSEAEKLIGRSRQPGSPTRTVLIVIGVVLGVILLVNLVSFGPLHGFGGGSSILLLLAVGGVILWLVNRPPTGTAAWTTTPSGTPPVVTPHDVAPNVTAPNDIAPSAVSPNAVSPNAVSPDPATLPIANETAATAVLTPSVSTAETTGFAYGGYGGYPGYQAPVPAPVPPPVPRPRSYLGLATMSLSLMTMGILGWLSMAGVVDIPAVVVLAAGLGVLGLGLLVGTLFGRARWLIALALPLLLVTVLVALVPSNVHLGKGIGERTWQPTTTEQANGPFELTVGDAVLDLTALQLPADGSTIPVAASVGIGELGVVVPAGVHVNVNATNGLGQITVEGLPRVTGEDRSVVAELPGVVPDSAPTIDLVVSVSLGNLEVSRA